MLNASDILYHVSYPTDMNALLEYGNEDVATIVDHFRSLLEMKGCNTAQVHAEINRYCTVLYSLIGS